MMKNKKIISGFNHIKNWSSNDDDGIVVGTFIIIVLALIVFAIFLVRVEAVIAGIGSLIRTISFFIIGAFIFLIAIFGFMALLRTWSKPKPGEKYPNVNRR